MTDQQVESTVVKAYSKLTLSLRVFRSYQSGNFENYHPIEAVMTSLDLADTLKISEGDGITVEGRYSAGVPEDNLVSKTLDLLGIRRAVVLTKNIPSGGGLGGGSTDAAALIRWALNAQDKNIREPARLLINDMGKVALDLGADVPFCINGGLSEVAGVGEILKPIPFVPREFYLFLMPFGISTKSVFEKFDQLGDVDSTESPNNLMSVAQIVEPRLKLAIDLINKRFGIIPKLAGSGSTLFYEIGDERESGILETSLEADFGLINIVKSCSVRPAHI